MAADDRHALRGDLLARGQQFGAEGGDDPLGHRARHDVAVHRAVLGGEVEQRRMRDRASPLMVGGRRGERHGECGRDGIVAIGKCW